jgi:hypothetical protein
LTEKAAHQGGFVGGWGKQALFASRWVACKDWGAARRQASQLARV